MGVIPTKSIFLFSLSIACAAVSQIQDGTYIPCPPKHRAEAVKPLDVPAAPSEHETASRRASTLRLLTSEDPATRARALEALRAFPSVETCAACVKALLDADAQVQKAAADTLAMMDPSRTCRAILDLLSGGTPEEQTAVTHVLPRLRDSVENPMLVILESEDEAAAARAAAAYALGSMGSTKAVSALSRCAWSEDADLAALSAAALARVGAVPDAFLFVALCTHPYPDVRMEAVRGLAHVGGPDAAVTLLDMVNGAEPAPVVRAEAAFLLGAIANDVPEQFDAILEALVRALRSGSPVREAAAHSLSRLTGQELGDHPMPWQEWLRVYKEHAAPAEEEETPSPPLVPHSISPGFDNTGR